MLSFVFGAGSEPGGSRLGKKSSRLIGKKPVGRGAAVLVLYRTPAYLASVAAGVGICSRSMLGRVQWHRSLGWVGEMR